MPRQRILIVDDHEDTRFVLATVLDHAGYDVVEARDGAEGVARAVGERPDLILMDMRMPGMDGVAAARLIRSRSGLEAVPIIAVTATVLGPTGGTEAATLFQATLLKPVRPAHLLEGVHGILGVPG